MPTSFLEKVGIVSLSMIGVQIFRNIMQIFYDHCLAQRTFQHNVNLPRMGEWAVVTGATSGIGKAFAHELAKQKINIVLISRTEYKLIKVAAELESEYRVQTRILVFDFINITHDNYFDLQLKLASLEIGILVNNVGMSYPFPEYFLDVPEAEVMFNCIIKCNIFSVTHMCRLLLPKMVHRGRGVIVNVSSMSADIPSPLLTVYAATKAYIESFSRNLEYEYGPSGIHVQCLVPGYVATKMSRLKRIPFFAPNPEEYVKRVIPLIGIQRVCTGYMPHTVMAYFINMLETCCPETARYIIRRTMEIVRSKAFTRNYRVVREFPLKIQ